MLGRAAPAKPDRGSPRGAVARAQQLPLLGVCRRQQRGPFVRRRRVAAAAAAGE